MTNKNGESAAIEETEHETMVQALEAVGVHFHELTIAQKKQAINQHVFLKTFEAAGTNRAAAKSVGITVHAVGIWKREDQLGFNARFNKAVETFADSLEDIAMARIKDPTGNRGSDVLLLAMLNAHKPEKYRTGIVVVDETPKAVAAKLAKMAQEDKETRDQEPQTTRVDNVTAIERMRAANKVEESG